MSGAPQPKGWQTINRMTQRLGLGENWIRSQLTRSDFTPEEFKVADGRILRHYSPDCYRWLRQQARVLKSYPKQGKYLTLQQAAHELGCSRHTVVQLLRNNSLSAPTLRRSINNRLIKCISPEDLTMLQQLLPPFAPAEFYNVNQLSLETGWPNDTVRGRLQQLGHVPEIYRSPITGEPHEYYPAEAKRVLGNRRNDIPPAGDWLTATRIGNEIGRSYHWTRSRIHRYSLASQLRLDDSGSSHRHYPPWVARELAAESAKVKTPSRPA